jgi:Multicopper oxidase
MGDVLSRELLRFGGVAALAAGIPPSDDAQAAEHVHAADSRVQSAPLLSNEAADYTLRIATGLIELGADPAASTKLYDGQFPGPLLRLTEGKRVVVDIHNDADTPKQLHWHGQFVSGRLNAASNGETVSTGRLLWCEAWVAKKKAGIAKRGELLQSGLGRRCRLPNLLRGERAVGLGFDRNEQRRQCRRPRRAAGRQVWPALGIVVGGAELLRVTDDQNLGRQAAVGIVECSAPVPPRGICHLIDGCPPGSICLRGAQLVKLGNKFWCATEAHPALHLERMSEDRKLGFTIGQPDQGQHRKALPFLLDGSDGRVRDSDCVWTLILAIFE